MAIICPPKVELVEIDPITSRSLYKKPDGSLVALIDRESELVVCDSSNRELGWLNRGSNYLASTGSIWISKPRSVVPRQCLGEYEFREGSYHVTPYTSDGMKDSQRREEIHPLDYLLRCLEPVTLSLF